MEFSLTGTKITPGILDKGTIFPENSLNNTENLYDRGQIYTLYTER